MGKLGHFSRVITEALALRKKLLADGLGEAETDRIVGQGLKTAWGTPSRQPWGYLCRSCRDTGWVQVAEDEYIRARWSRLYGDSTKPEPFYAKCHVDCAYLLSERRKRIQVSGEEEGLAAAGQTKRWRR